MTWYPLRDTSGRETARWNTSSMRNIMLYLAEVPPSGASIRHHLRRRFSEPGAPRPPEAAPSTHWQRLVMHFRGPGRRLPGLQAGSALRCLWRGAGCSVPLAALPFVAAARQRFEQPARRHRGGQGCRAQRDRAPRCTLDAKQRAASAAPTRHPQVRTHNCVFQARSVSCSKRSRRAWPLSEWRSPVAVQP